MWKGRGVGQSSFFFTMKWHSMFGATLSGDAVLLGIARRILQRWSNPGWEGALCGAVVCCEG